MTGTKSISAYTEQYGPAPTPPSDDAPIPQEFWTVVLLSVILFVLVVWKVIDEMADGGSDGGDNNSGNRFPPF
jgi:hypothetical protein